MQDGPSVRRRARKSGSQKQLPPAPVPDDDDAFQKLLQGSSTPSSPSSDVLRKSMRRSKAEEALRASAIARFLDLLPSQPVDDDLIHVQAVLNRMVEFVSYQVAAACTPGVIDDLERDQLKLWGLLAPGTCPRPDPAASRSYSLRPSGSPPAQHPTQLAAASLSADSSSPRTADHHQPGHTQPCRPRFSGVSQLMGLAGRPPAAENSSPTPGEAHTSSLTPHTDRALEPPTRSSSLPNSTPSPGAALPQPHCAQAPTPSSLAPTSCPSPPRTVIIASSAHAVTASSAHAATASTGLAAAAATAAVAAAAAEGADADVPPAKTVFSRASRAGRKSTLPRPPAGSSSATPATPSRVGRTKAGRHPAPLRQGGKGHVGRQAPPDLVLHSQRLSNHLVRGAPPAAPSGPPPQQHTAGAGGATGSGMFSKSRRMLPLPLAAGTAAAAAAAAVAAAAGGWPAGAGTAQQPPRVRLQSTGAQGEDAGSAVSAGNAALHTGPAASGSAGVSPPVPASAASGSSGVLPAGAAARLQSRQLTQQQQQQALVQGVPRTPAAVGQPRGCESTAGDDVRRQQAMVEKWAKQASGACTRSEWPAGGSFAEGGGIRAELQRRVADMWRRQADTVRAEAKQDSKAGRRAGAGTAWKL